MKRVLILLMFALPAAAQEQKGPPTEDRYIITFVPGTSQAKKSDVVQKAGAAVRHHLPIANAVAVRAPNANAHNALANDPSVASVVPDRAILAIDDMSDQSLQSSSNVNGGSVSISGGTTTSTQVIPAGVKRVGVSTTTSNGAGIGVAIIDTGIDLANADLTVSQLRFTVYGTSCQDDNGHGTHVAGIVAAKNNTIGVVGVAPLATVYCVKVLDSFGNGYDSDVIAGLQFIAQNAASAAPPIRVVNMSLGRAGTVNDNPVLRAAFQTLYNAGITVVVAAGNDSSREVKNTVPAGYPEVLAVASTSALVGTTACTTFKTAIKADTASFFTTDGAYAFDSTAGGNVGVTTSAPGEDQENVAKTCTISSVGILSLKVGGGTIRMSGTSMAAPHVAGIAARMIQTNTAWTPETIRTALRNSAQLAGTTPLNSPAGGYTFDGQREGIAKAP